MWFMWLLSWISSVLQICFATLAIAAGLYYLAELVEEYTKYTAKVIKFLTVATLSIYVCLFLFEELTTTMILAGVAAQISHLFLLQNFPFFNLTSPSFLTASALVIINHYLAFNFFGEHYYPFSEVMAYFTMCLWLVPFAFFVSLSANENVLPTTSERRPLLQDENDVVSNYFMRKEKRNGLLSIFNGIRESVLPTRTKKAY
jgi:hypothetical protein